MNDILNLNDRFLNYSNMLAVDSHKRMNKIDKNINSVKDYKQAEFENHRDKIERIHSKLMATQPISADSYS